jgi:hypothetical protein
MILAFLALVASASASCDAAAAVEQIRASPSKDLYMCLVEEESAGEELAAAIDAGGAGQERLTRALALWLLQRTDREMEPAMVRRLSPADRRLVSDGIHARRGRRTPVAEHAAVFQQFSWYEPDAGYTDVRLRDVDRKNIATLDKPPAAPVDAPVQVADTPADPTAPATASKGLVSELCGCDAGAGEWTGLVGLGAAALATLRRQR